MIMIGRLLKIDDTGRLREFWKSAMFSSGNGVRKSFKMLLK